MSIATPALQRPTHLAGSPTREGTAPLSISDTYVSQSGASPIPSIAFALILLVALLTLAYANVRTVRNRR